MSVNFNDPQQQFGDSSSTYAANNSSFIGFASGPIEKQFVVFKAFLKDFSFERTVSTDPIKDLGDPWKNRIVIGTLDNDSYKISFSVLSASLEEAKINHWKLQTLYRLAQQNKTQVEASPPRKKSTAETPPKPQEKTANDNLRAMYEEMGIEVDAAVVTPAKEVVKQMNKQARGPRGEKLKMSSFKAKTSVYFGNLIAENAEEVSLVRSITRDFIIAKGKNGVISDLSYSPIMDLGFYSDGVGSFFAKGFDFSFELILEKDSSNVAFSYSTEKERYTRKRTDKLKMFGAGSYNRILKNEEGE